MSIGPASGQTSGGKQAIQVWVPTTSSLTPSTWTVTKAKLLPEARGT